MSEERKLPNLIVTKVGVPFADQAEGLRLFKEACLAASAKVERLSRELDIANADHIAFWLGENMADSSHAWLACRIVEAHEAAIRTLSKERDMAVEALRIFMDGEVDVSGTALIYEDLAHVAMLGEATLAQLEASKGEVMGDTSERHQCP
ncbi:hypothetical protein [Sphingobium sp. CFD-1]|uniref:hypothetical protein n=1 Tax=Sphingobium sp. CFD-1 TaxID=2878545 RepID=UPI00214B6471|nr:hypothetical protein [Sphingobium sp. CFD-1]